MQALLWVWLVLSAESDIRATKQTEAANGQAKSANRKLVVTVFGKPLYAEQLVPDDSEARKKELPKAEYDDWLRKSLGAAIYRNVWGAACQKYIAHHKL